MARVAPWERSTAPGYGIPQTSPKSHQRCNESKDDNWIGNNLRCRLSWVKWDGHPTSFSDTNPSLQYVAAIPISLGCPKMFSVSRVQFWATCKRPSSSSSPWTSDPCWVNLFLAEHLTKWAHTHRKGDWFFFKIGTRIFLGTSFLAHTP